MENEWVLFCARSLVSIQILLLVYEAAMIVNHLIK